MAAREGEVRSPWQRERLLFVWEAAAAAAAASAPAGALPGRSPAPGGAFPPLGSTPGPENRGVAWGRCTHGRGVHPQPERPCRRKRVGLK